MASIGLLARIEREGVRMRAKGRLLTVTVCAAFALTTAACDDAGTKPSELSESSSTSAAPTSVPDESSASPSADSEEQAVIAAYKGWFEAVNGMGLATDEQVAEALAPYGTDEIVQKTVTFFANKRSEGLMPGGSVDFSDIQVQLGVTEATTLECRDASTETSVEISSGNVVGTGVPGTRIQAQLVPEQDGTWRMSDYSAHEGEC